MNVAKQRTNTCMVARFTTGQNSLMVCMLFSMLIEIGVCVPVAPMLIVIAEVTFQSVSAMFTLVAL